MTVMRRVRQRLRREASRLFACQPVRVAPLCPIVSFTFDDFPASALRIGGEILRQHGFTATFYASFGLMGQAAATGEIFAPDDLPELLRQGHELGCHTFDHCHAWDTPPAQFEASIARNQQAVRELGLGVHLRTLSYPISGPRPATKRYTARHYVCARGGGQTFNAQFCDALLLKAFFLEQARGGLLKIQHMIEACVRSCGWLILATHDVCAQPTRFGCTPRLLDQVVKCTAQSGAQVLPVAAAFELITGAARDGSVGGN